MNKALKFALTGFLFFCLSSTYHATAQRVYFCKSVSADGDPVGLNQFFYIPENGINISLLIKLPQPIDATSIELRFFKLDSLNNETYVSSVPFDVEKTWTWFWKGVDFHEAARYKVYVFADKERLLCSEVADAFYHQ